MLELRDLQAALADHLVTCDRPDIVAAVAGGSIAAAARLEVYRHHVQHSLGVALAATFPTVRALGGADFFGRLTRDFVRQCQTPVLILPDDIPAHPYAVAMEAAMLAPRAEVSIFPWKEPKERIPLAVRQIRSFLRAHRPASV